MNVNVNLNLLGILDIKRRELSLDLPTNATLNEAIDAIDQYNPGFKDAITSRDGAISSQFVFFINGRNAAHLEGRVTKMGGGDVINVIPAIAGG